MSMLFASAGEAFWHVTFHSMLEIGRHPQEFAENPGGILTFFAILGGIVVGLDQIFGD
jgi:hypothetical protein